MLYNLHSLDVLSTCRTGLPSSSINAGYFAVLCYLFLKASAIDTLRSLSPNGTPLEEEVQARYHSLGLVISIPIALFFSILPTSTTIPIKSSASSGTPMQTTLATLSLLAFALFVADPILNRAVSRRTITIRGFKGTWMISVLAVAFIGVTAFERTLHIADFVIGSIAYWGEPQFFHPLSSIINAEPLPIYQVSRISCIQIPAWQQKHQDVAYHHLSTGTPQRLERVKKPSWNPSRSNIDRLELQSRLSLRILIARRFTIFYA